LSPSSAKAVAVLSSAIQKIVWMKISLINAGKRFNRDWIFRKVNYEFISGKSYAITGPNGSGKSTLLQMIGGAISPSEGEIKFQVSNLSQNGLESTEEFFKYISIAAPYLELVDEMTLIEFLDFHGKFKSFLSSFSTKKIVDRIGLEDAANKQIRYFSSGMKQRVKLAQAILSDVPCILLDEPCTNLDSNGIDLYHQLINDHCKKRLVIVSSNDQTEYEFCEERILMTDYAKSALARN
jgi:ABC-type multidrug transport system ATPase subunit